MCRLGTAFCCTVASLSRDTDGQEAKCKSLGDTSVVNDVDSAAVRIGSLAAAGLPQKRCCKAGAALHAEHTVKRHTSWPMGFQCCMTLLRLLDVLRAASARLLLADVPCSLSSRTKSGSSTLQHTVTPLNHGRQHCGKQHHGRYP